MPKFQRIFKSKILNEICVISYWIILPRRQAALVLNWKLGVRCSPLGFGILSLGFTSLEVVVLLNCFFRAKHNAFFLAFRAAVALAMSGSYHNLVANAAETGQVGFFDDIAAGHRFVKISLRFLAGFGLKSKQ